MDNGFSDSFAKSVLTAIFSSGLVVIGVYIFFLTESQNALTWMILIGIVAFPTFFYYHFKNNLQKTIGKQVEDLKKELQDTQITASNSEDSLKRSIGKQIEGFQRELKDMQIDASNSETLAKAAEHKADVWKQSLQEKTSGFPTLFEYIELYDKIIDDHVSNLLLQKVRPAPRAAEEVKEQSRKRREAEKKQRITQEIIEFYERLEPSLIEYKNEQFGNIDEILEEWTEEEKSDPVSYFIAKDEYRNKSPVERNQLALDRYWKRPHSNWHIGIMYERYIGYLYEIDGYRVTYQGVKEGKRDLGRDLIAKKGNNIIVIQCKYWNKFRQVFENEIFQFFGTVFQYRHANKSKNIKGYFYTTTTVSELAKSFANELGIVIIENFPMDKSYPCIKCNVSDLDRTKIYHLPFDQQYDNVLIEPEKGESYCRTTVDAEEKGFRRAWRWSGN